MVACVDTLQTRLRAYVTLIQDGSMQYYQMRPVCMGRIRERV